MDNPSTLLALVALLSACSPTLPPTDEDGGTSTGLEESESSGPGATATSAALDSSDGSSDSSGSTGSESSESSSGGLGCVFDHVFGACQCDGVLAEPSECCEVVGGVCECDGERYPEAFCVPGGCAWSAGVCICDTVELHGCELDANGICSCDEPVNPPPECCPSACELGAAGCVCDGVPAPGANCGCEVLFGVACYCDGAGPYPPTFCT